jgi:hypothetical protein
VSGWNGQIRPAGAGDCADVAGLAAELARSFAFSPEKFRASYPALLADPGARLLPAVNDIAAARSAGGSRRAGIG